jgi:hypothetical protein
MCFKHDGIACGSGLTHPATLRARPSLLCKGLINAALSKGEGSDFFKSSPLERI